jgi:DNA-binding PadR family transcriptional regulator
VEKKQYVFGGVGCVSGEVLEAPTADWLPPFLLLALREEDLHDEELVYEMVALGFAPSRTETILRALSEMEAEGLVASEPGGKPFGRRYEIASTGEAYLEAWANSLAALRDEVDLLLGLRDGPPVLAGCGSRAAL